MQFLCVPIPYLKGAQGIAPKRPNAYKNLALAYQGLGEVTKAGELFMEATRVDPGDPRALGHLEVLFRKNPTLEREIPHFLERLSHCRASVTVVQQQFKSQNTLH